MESTMVETNPEETEKKISDLCNMSWLKNSPKSSTNTNQNSQKCTELVPKTQKEEYLVPESKAGKKRKQKKSKARASANAPKDVNSKNSDTDSEQISQQDKRKANLSSVAAVVDSNSPTVWNSKSNAASTLFPDVQSLKIEVVDENVQLSKALEESIITAQLEKFRLAPEASKVNWADDSEEPGWGAVHSNLPEPSEEKNKEIDKMEKKAPDDNNNSHNKTNTANEQELKRVDKYGRVDGYTERHLFMGKGARMREQHVIGQQNSRNEHISGGDSHTDRNRDQRNFRERNSESYDNRNKCQKDFGDRNNRFSNYDDRREFRNRNFQPSNQRGQRQDNYSNRYESQSNRFGNQSNRYENQSNRYENQSNRYENQSNRYENHSNRYEIQSNRHENQSNRYENHSNRYENQSNRYDNQNRHDNYPNRHDNHSYQRDNQQRYNQQRIENQYENHSQGFGNLSQKYDHQHMHENQHPRLQGQQFLIKNQNLAHSNKFEGNRGFSAESECNKSTIPEKVEPLKEPILPKEEPNPPKVEIVPPKEEKDKSVSLKEPVRSDSRTSTPLIDDESSSLIFMQNSFKDDESGSCDNVAEIIDHASETMSEKSEYQENLIMSSNPFHGNFQPIPMHMVHQPTILCSNPDDNMQIPNEIAYKMVSNPFIAPVPVSNQHFQHQPQEMIAKETVPIQNLDMRYFPQHPMNIVHNHPTNPFVPVINYPMAIPIQSCGQISPVPVGNVQGMNFMPPQSVNCQQCPTHYCHTQRIPLQNLNCQNPMYPAQFVTPITSMPLPMAPISPDQVQSMRNSHPGKVPTDKMITPVSEIGKSVSNLVSLCENLPSRRREYPKAPPGFEDGVYSSSTQRKIIFNKEQDSLPSFRNNPRVPAQSVKRGPKKTEKFTVEKLNNIYEEINSNSNSDFAKEKETEILRHWPENTGKINESHSNTKLAAPRPGFRVGLGRGKRLGPTT